MAKPLTHLLKKDIPFNWENQQQVAFENLKHKLTTAPLLIYPDFTKSFVLTCDASNYAVAAVLSQGPVGKDRPIAYASRTLNKSETNYSTTEKELLAILFGCKTFRPYLFGNKFEIITDHRPLKWLFNHKDPSSKLQRWRLKLEEYEYEITYRKGRLNSAADALSRYPVNPILPGEDSLVDLGALDLSPYDDNLGIDFSPLDPATPTINPENENLLPELVDTPSALPEMISTNPNNLPDDVLPDITATPSPLPGTLNDTDYSTFLKEITKNITYNTNLSEHNQSLLKGPSNILIIPTSLDLDEANPYVTEILSSIKNTEEFLNSERELCSFKTLELNTKIIYFAFIKVHHFDESTYQDIFKTLKSIRNELLITQNSNEIAISDFKSPFEKLSFAKIYNMITYLFHNTDIAVNIYHNNIIYPTLSEIKKILHENHDIPIAGHLGSTRMLKRIQERFYWKGMRTDIENYVKKCTLCQQNKPLRKTNKAPMQITTTSTSPFQRVSLDVVGPLPESGSAKLKYILTLQDDLTKYSVAYPIRTITAEETMECLIHFISLFSIPKTILTDQGSNFAAELFKKTCEFLKIKQLWCSPYHPQTQGALERSHSTLKEYLKSFVDSNQENWPRYVYTAMLTYNTNIHCTTNFSPHELLFGHKPYLPDSIFEDNSDPTYPDYLKMLNHRLKLSRDKAIANISNSKQKSKIRYDTHTRNPKYKVGDYVYLKNHLRLRKALSPIWKGPYKIVKVHNNNTVSLLINRRHVKHHIDEIKPANYNPP